jgi:hypothetical protein
VRHQVAREVQPVVVGVERTERAADRGPDHEYAPYRRRRAATGDFCEAFAMISIDDYLYFVDEALDGMVRLVSDLGDDLANRRPDVAGSNSPFVLLTHCLGVMEYWGGHIVAGRRIERDRDAEFRASGRVKDLVEHTTSARQKFAADLSRLEPFAPPRGEPFGEDADLPLARTQGGALLHVYEELAQHRRQMEGCRDVLLAPWAVTV